MLDQQIKHLENQSAALNNHLMELMMTSQSLEDINNTKDGTEILTPLSSGIYTKAELKDGKNFIVNVGANIAVVKNLDSTKELIETQIDEIKKLQETLASQLQTQTNKATILDKEINKIASEVQNK